MSTTATQDKKRVHELKRVFAIAKEVHGMPAEVLREQVQGWGFPRLSQCSYQDLKSINRFLGTWFKAREGADYCSQSQLDYLQRLWREKSASKDRKSLVSYWRRRTGYNDPSLASPTEMSREINGLRKWDS